MSRTPDRLIRNEWAWFAVGVVACVGIALWSTAPRAPEPVFERAIAFSMVITGLGALFSSAAFGPKTDPEKLNRVRNAAMHAGFVLIGVSKLVPEFRARAVIGSIALLFMLAAAARIPKALFASSR